MIAWLANRTPVGGCIVVVGPAAWEFAGAARSDITVYGVDAGAPRERIDADPSRQGPSGYQTKENVFLLSGESPWDFVGWRRDIDLVYFDGSATPTQFSVDFWTEFVRTGGVIAGDHPGDDDSEILKTASRLARRLGSRLDLAGSSWSITRDCNRSP